MQHKSKARIALFGGIFLISIYPVLVKFLGDLSVVSAFYRMFISAIGLSLLAVARPMNFPNGKLLLGSFLCGVLFGLDVYCWNLAIELSSATQGTLLSNLAPIFVGLLAFLFLPNKPRINFWLGSALAFIGMIVFIGWKMFASLSFDQAFLLGIASAMLYACYITLSKFILEKTEVLLFLLINNIGASLFLGGINYIHNQPFTGFTVQQWSILIVGGLLCQLLAWFLISYATKYMRATTVSLSLLSQTLFAALLASWFLKENISLQAVLGGVIILTGIALTFLKKPLFKKHHTQ